MDYRILGNTGVKVSALCFGTMSFGGDADEATSAAMFNRCRDAGINFFDCANVYQAGRVRGDSRRPDRRLPRGGRHHDEGALPDGDRRQRARLRRAST